MTKAATPPVRLQFIKFVVRDLDAMLAFYENALGLSVLRTIETETMLEKVMGDPDKPAGMNLLLYWYKDGRDVTVGNGHGPLGCFVPDADKAYAHAIAHGATPHRPPFDLNSLRLAFVHDPEGREIEFLARTN